MSFYKINDELIKVAERIAKRFEIDKNLVVKILLELTNDDVKKIRGEKN